MRKTLAHIHEKTCSSLFIAALCLVAKHLKQLSYLSMGKWRNELWHSHSQSTAHIKEKELALHISTWMKLKDIIGPQKQVAKEYYLNLSCNVNMVLHTIFCLGKNTHHINMYVYVCSFNL